MATPSPESQPPTSPPADDDSSPLPPPAEDSPSAPPPSPPPPASSPPPPAASPPPPQESPSPPPPPPPTESPPSPTSSSTPPPPPPKSFSSHSPPPPSSSSGHSPPHAPQSALAPPKSSSHSAPSTDSNSALPYEKDGSSGLSQELPIIIGVAAGAGLLLLVMILLCIACRRKKKKQPNPASFYGGPPDPSNGPRIQNGYPSAVGGLYYPNQHQQEASWRGSPAEHAVKLRPPPGMPLSPTGNHLSPSGMPAASASSHSSWPPPPPRPYGSSSDMSSTTFSGSHRPGVLSPQSVALGFTQCGFSYEELAIATDGFCKDHILGQGGFGYVFKGVLPSGKETAIKCLKSGSGQGDREFQAEVEIISRVHHRHLVSLEGYCIAGAQRILVYEFVPNKTLEYHLHGKDRPTMDWATRLKIALGSAKGLAYLHEDCYPRIIHRDIKAANILLDCNFEAKVADFGLAKLTSDNYTHVSTRVMGTFGYLAPEYASSGKLTEKSDTFSFGVMLLELITGRRPVDATGELMDDSLVDWARPLIDSALQSRNFSQLADPRLEENFDPQEMARMVACAGACTRHSAKRRPKMSQVARALEGDSSLDDLNTWNKQTQSSAFGDSSGSSSSTICEGGTSYATDMKKFRPKVAPLDSHGEYASSEYGATSEYGLNPSSSSSSSGESGEISSHGHGNRHSQIE